MMKKYKISYGLGGGFGGANEDDEIYEFENEDQAIHFAWEKACEEYDSYAGYHGLRSVEEIMEEDGIDDEDEAWEVYCEEREDWIEYEVEEIE
jgi:hypothetical protein